MCFSCGGLLKSTFFNLSHYYDTQFKDHLTVARATSDALKDSFHQWTDMCHTSLTQGGKLLFFGNGGSAADAQHLATEFTVRFIKNRKPIPALALTTDTSALTAIGNDLGFEFLFSRQIEALGRPGDIAIGISTSGRSANVIEGFKIAQHQGLKTVALTGGTGGELANHVDLMLTVPSQTTSRIQEMHITLGQMLCGALEQTLGHV